jgi:anaerobic selenocysteine-containing dehydrogenase
MREVRSFCRFCIPFCGTRVTLDDQDRIVEVRGDKDDLMTQGYACIKGLQAPASYNAPDRVLRTLKRQPDGSFTPIPLEQALDEIAEKLKRMLAAHGPESVGLFRGAGGMLNASAMSMSPAFLSAIGSHKNFTTYTIDQSAKTVTPGRLGIWNAPRHPLHDSDVRLMFGANPLVSVSISNFDNQNTTKRMREARARGMKLIVVDPRKTETAQFADVFLQPYPGEDPSIAAGMLHVILQEGWEDKEFCERYVADLDVLRAAVARFTPEYVAQRAGINAEDLRKAASLFARETHRGGAAAGTGPSMAPHSNLSDHLIEALNVVCGRYMREGEQIANPGVLRARRPQRAQVTAAPRWWENSFKSRIGGFGMLGDEMVAGILADEILQPGEGQIRAMFVHGSNLANIMPDQNKMVRALRSLELLVNIEPYMNETSTLSHYIIPSKMAYERADLTMYSYESLYTRPYARYTPPIAAPPEGSELVDDWEIFWGLAKRLDLPLTFDGVELDMSQVPTTDSLLAINARSAPIPFDELKTYELGRIFDEVPQYVEPAEPDCKDRFTLAPPDVLEEMEEVYRERNRSGADQGQGQTFTHRLTSRRVREVCNSSHRNVPAIRKRMPYNFAYLHPEEIAKLGIESGQKIKITSDAGSISGIVKADPTLRMGVVSMTHGWGALPGETVYERDGSNTGLLISTDRDLEKINAMPRMSAIPVNIEPM